MKVEIFDVEHGGCAFITANSGARMLIDCGSNSSTGWRPSLYLSRIGVEKVESTPKSEIRVIFFQFGSGTAIFNKSYIHINHYIS